MQGWGGGGGGANKVKIFFLFLLPFVFIFILFRIKIFDLSYLLSPLLSGEITRVILFFLPLCVSVLSCVFIEKKHHSLEVYTKRRLKWMIGKLFVVSLVENYVIDL